MDEDTSVQPDLQPQESPSVDATDATPPVRSVPRRTSTPPPPGAKWTKTIHPRGRQARDPLAQHVRLAVTSADQMETLLRDYLASPTSAAEHTIIEFSFATSSAFMVYTGEYSGGSQPKANLYGTLNRSAVSVDAALSACAADTKDGLRKQKSIAKTLVEHVQKADGYRYSFHNNWMSKEDQAHRFSYFCNDSTLNKGRAANEGAGMNGKRKMKAVYDCHGTIHVKFSITKQSMELHYKHIPIHQTYDERAPVPRKNSKRRKIMEVFEPEKLVRGRKRKARDDTVAKVSKRRARELPDGSPDVNNGEGTNDSLGPLIDFLGSAEREANRDPQHDSVDASGEEGTESALPFPAEKLEALKSTKRRQYRTPRQGVVRPPSLQVPGMMSGYMAGDLITWGSRQKRQNKRQSGAPNEGGTEPLAGIAQAAAEVDTDSAAGLSEIEQLKAKLAEAEQRINRLESEKSQPKAGPPGWPPPPTSVSYPYPQPQFGAVPYQNQPYQYPPPPQPGQHGSPNTQSPVPGAELRTVQWDPKLVSGGGKKGRPVTRASNPEPQPAPPRGGQIIQL